MSNLAIQEELADKILGFWFGDLEEAEVPGAECRRRWWIKDEATDDLIRDTFEEDLNAAMDLKPGDLKLTPKGSLALIILLDQFSRNIYRGTPSSFSQDDIALKIALIGIAVGLDRDLNPFERIFYYMPLMHSEDKEIQQISLECFKGLEREFPEPGELNKKLRESLEYAEKHARIIERFGRYPHRNEILGRESTREEKEFLKGPGSSF